MSSFINRPVEKVWIIEKQDLVLQKNIIYSTLSHNTQSKNFLNNKGKIVKFWVFYQLCHLSLVIPVLSLAIPALSLAILGLSLLVPSQFNDVPDSYCLTFYQQYINSYYRLNILGTKILYIFQKNI